MIGRYLGHLDRQDPLFGYLRDEIAPQLGLDSSQADFRVFQSSSSRNVFLYEERHSGERMIGKFYPAKTRFGGTRKTGEVEYQNLVYLRSLGFDAPPRYVVKPLGFNPDLGNLLLMEYLDGDLLGKVIDRAVHHGGSDRLFRKLSALAGFLAALHNRTACGDKVDFNQSLAYMGRLIESLTSKRGMGRDQADEFYRLREAWRGYGPMWEDVSALNHGDATPSNFLFGHGDAVLAIDLERMRWADRAFDLGRLCGELTHFFYQGMGDPMAAEPFIGHFLWEYACHFPDRRSAFSAITRRIPFYMGATLLRIARNSWIGQEYRWKLTGHAKHILRNPP